MVSSGMKTLLIVFDSVTGGTRQMAQAWRALQHMRMRVNPGANGDVRAVVQRLEHEINRIEPV